MPRKSKAAAKDSETNEETHLRPPTTRNRSRSTSQSESEGHQSAAETRGRGGRRGRQRVNSPGRSQVEEKEKSRKSASRSRSKRKEAEVEAESMVVVDPPAEDLNSVEESKAQAQDLSNDVEMSESSDNPLMDICQKHWLNKVKWDSSVVQLVYRDYLAHNRSFRLRQIMFLEFNQFLEKFLLPHFDASKSSKEHLLSMIIMLNEKCREKQACWDTFSAETFSAFFHSVLQLSLSSSLSYFEKSQVMTFFVNVFANIETQMVRTECLPLINLSTWHCLIATRREKEIGTYPQLRKIWKHFEKKHDQATEAGKKKIEFERSWLSEMLKDLIVTVQTAKANSDALTYCERFLEFLIDLETQLPTRRYVNTLIDDHQLIPALQSCSITSVPSKATKLFRELLSMLSYYSRFDMDDHTGQEFSEAESTQRHYSRMTAVQKALFKNESTRDLMQDFCMASIASLDNPEAMHTHFSKMSVDQLVDLFDDLSLRSASFQTGKSHGKGFMIDILVYKLAKRSSLIEKLAALPVYPNETEFWDRGMLSTEQWSGDHCLAMPKMNLQFLTMHDYLQRNYQLYRLESTHEIRQDIEDAIMRLNPKASTVTDSRNWTSFSGWSSMALPIENFEIVNIAKPNVGENQPSNVSAEISYSLSHYREDIADQWDTIRRHDVMFLISIRAPIRSSGETWTGGETGVDKQGRTFQEFFGIQSVRGCEVIEFRDEDGQLLVDKSGRPLIEGERIKTIGARRKLLVQLDTNQFHLDTQHRVAAEARGENPLDPYKTFNVLLRRSAKENNFKSILETIRDLMLAPTQVVVPDWLHNIFLGYGDPTNAHYLKMINREEEVLSSQLKAAGATGGISEEKRRDLRSIDFQDTFLDWNHLENSFPEKSIVEITPDAEEKRRLEAIQNIRRKQGLLTQEQLMSDGHLLPPYVIRFDRKGKHQADDKKSKRQDTNNADDEVLHVTNFHKSYGGPIAEIRPRYNHIRFTPKQIEAIRSGCSPGLSVIVGPPGTGKTDVAVQIISNVYHNNPDQHTLIITHSNQALNQLFEKLVNLNINERHLLRLGQGQEELSGQQNWSKYGRVYSFLERRLELLKEVERLSNSMNLFAGDVGSTCENASNFFSYHICSRWYRFEEKWSKSLEEASRKKMKPAEDREMAASMIQEFPFNNFFASAPAVLEKQMQVFPPNSSLAEVFEITRGCWLHLQGLFEELAEMRAFELLPSNWDRSNYLLTKGARIIAMTCTHAAIKRNELISLGFRYDNVIMEEAAQILEIETFIPLLLQTTTNTGGMSRLKRVVLIGDHNQLPPIVQNTAFQKYCNMEQSLFKRFVRLGVPTIELDAQGRCRPSLRQLFSWRYANLHDLPVIHENPEFKYMNPGFVHEYQFINVEDFMGRGESEPMRHFVQNLGEAEYVVAVYQYMRLLGYPADKITILTTYNGQKALIKDVLKERCAWNPMFGVPSNISTVDKFQGQQNDYILLSLVRSKTVGHLRDVRRLIVAMSRARLGLYVFGRQSLFEGCLELQPVFEQLLSKPTQLKLFPAEKYQTGSPSGTLRQSADQVPKSEIFTATDVQHMGSFVYEMCQKGDVMLDTQVGQ